jgi:flagellar hook assembly protein FlgD
VLEIVNSAGQRLLHRDLGSLAPGSTEVLWDGHTDGGRPVAPGVYTAWLISGSTRISVKLVRVP